MAARAYWKGQIRLALVSIPVEIFTATKSGATIAFNQIHEPSGKRIKYEKVVPGIGPVEPDEIVKGYQYEKGAYVLVKDEEIEAVKLESKKTLELTQFVDNDDIEVMYFEKPYYVVPADDLAEEAYIVLREALKSTNKVAVGQLAMRGREYLVSLKPLGRGILLETMRYPDEINKPANYFRDIEDGEPDEELLELAEALIERKSGKFDPSKYHDRYVEALEDLIDRKRKGKTIRTDEEEARPARGMNVVDLMAALKRSVDKGEAPAKRGKTAERKVKRRTEAPERRKAHAPARKRA